MNYMHLWWNLLRHQLLWHHCWLSMSNLMSSSGRMNVLDLLDLLHLLLHLLDLLLNLLLDLLLLNRHAHLLCLSLLLPAICFDSFTRRSARRLDIGSPLLLRWGDRLIATLLVATKTSLVCSLDGLIDLGKPCSLASSSEHYTIGCHPCLALNAEVRPSSLRSLHHLTTLRCTIALHDDHTISRSSMARFLIAHLLLYPWT